MTQVFQATVAFLLIGMYIFCMLMYFSDGIKFSKKRLLFVFLLSFFLTIALNREFIYTKLNFYLSFVTILPLIILNFLKIYFSIETGIIYRNLVPVDSKKHLNLWFSLLLIIFYSYFGSRYASKNLETSYFLDYVIFIPVIEEITFRLGVLSLFIGIFKSIRFYYFIASVIVSLLFTFMHPVSVEYGIFPLVFIIFPLSLLLCQVRIRYFTTQLVFIVCLIFFLSFLRSLFHKLTLISFNYQI